jgi:hypothetical protein
MAVIQIVNIMKKLTRLDIDTLQKEMPVLDYDAMVGIMGGYDPGDCWWRCIAYIKSCEQSYSEDDAMALACAYYGSSFNSNHYAFSGSIQDCRNYASEYVINSGDSYCPNDVLIFDPRNVNWTGAKGERHAVIITGYALDVYYIYDPQNEASGIIDATQLASATTAIVRVR